MVSLELLPAVCVNEAVPVSLPRVLNLSGFLIFKAFLYASILYLFLGCRIRAEQKTTIKIQICNIKVK